MRFPRYTLLNGIGVSPIRIFLPFLGLILIASDVLVASEDECWTIARLKYSGGGDWYSDPTALANLLRRVKKDLGANVCDDYVTMTLLDAGLYNYPILYMTGHGNIAFTEEERQVLREFLYHGGLLFADDNYGMDSSFRREMKALFRDSPLFELPASHSIFSAHFSFSGGLPKIHKHNGKRPQALGMALDNRLAVLYTYESDLGDGWENPEVHNVPAHLREKALRMGVNVVAWFLQGQSIR